MQFAMKLLDGLFRPIVAGVQCLQGDMLLSDWKRRAVAVKRFEHGPPAAGSKSFLDDITIPQNATDGNGGRGMGIRGMFCWALHHSGCLSLRLCFSRCGSEMQPRHCLDFKRMYVR